MLTFENQATNYYGQMLRNFVEQLVGVELILAWKVKDCLIIGKLAGGALV